METNTYFLLPKKKQIPILNIWILIFSFLIFSVEGIQAQEYCIPELDSQHYIGSFSTTGGFENIENFEIEYPGSGFVNFYDQVVSQARTELVEFNAQDITDSGTENPVSTRIRIWVDWNQDGNFGNDEIAYQSSISDLSHQGEFQVPIDAKLGKTRMRVGVRTGYNSPTASCSDSSTYAYQDYSIEVLEVLDCIRPLSVSVDEITFESVDVSWESNADEWEIKYSTNPDFDPETEGESVMVSENPETTLTDIEETFTYYAYIKTICDSGESSWSDMFEFSIPLEGEHCIPETESQYYISSFSTTGGINNIENYEIEYPGSGFANFYDQVVSQNRTENIEFEVGEIMNASNDNSISATLRIWIDWNQDGSFDNDELVFSSNQSTTHSGVFQIPEEALLGKTRMRIGIRNSWNSPTSCSNNSSYAYQDYGIEILEVLECVRPLSVSVDEITFESVDVSWESNADEWEIKYSTNPDFDPETEGESVMVSENPETTLTDIEETFTYYAYIKTICDSGESSWSDMFEFSIPLEGEHCIPELDSQHYIGSFSTTGGINNIENFEIEYPGSGFVNFYDQVVSQARTELVEFNAQDIIDSSTENPVSTRIRIWVDWNQDGNFGNDEIAYQSSISDLSHQGGFQVPIGAKLGKTRMRVGVRTGYNSPTDSCSGSSTYAYQDYSIEVLEVLECVRPLSVSVDEITFESVDVSWESNADQWEIKYSTNPDFDPETEGESVIVSENPETTLTDIEETFTYYAYIKTICDSGESSWSDKFEFSIPLEGEHCIPETESQYYISSFSTTGGINNIENYEIEYPGSGFANFYDQVVSQNRTENIEFEVGEIMNASNDNSISATLRIWIDWNQDGSFDNDELVFSSNQSTTHSGVFQIPEEALLGKTRMRVGVRTGYNSPTASCSDSSTYAYQDYSIEVLEVLDCIRPLSVSVDEITFESVDVSWESNADQWEIKYSTNPDFDPETEGESVIVSENPETTLTDIEETFTYYAYIKTICDSGESSWSDKFEFSIPLEGEHCIPETESQYYISSFSTTGGINNIENYEIEYPGSGFANFYDQVVSQNRTENIEFEVGEIMNASNDNSISATLRIWIDWNQDGSFDNDELVFSSNQSTTHSGVFQIPEEALLGKTRMRIGIRNSWNSPTSCSNNSSYAYQDYGIEILEVLECIRPLSVSVDEITFESVGISWESDADEWEIKYSTNPDFDPETEGESVIVSENPETTLTDIEETFTYYAYIKTICDSGESNWSDMFEFSIPLEGEHCIPETESQYYISSFSTTGGINNIENYEIEYPGSGFANFYDQVVSQNRTENIEFEVGEIMNASNDNSISATLRIWVDWNQDGNFGNDEIAYQSSISDLSHQGGFQVPIGAKLGKTRMRVGVRTGYNSPTASCSDS